jgi:hypothetical protein
VSRLLEILAITALAMYAPLAMGAGRSQPRLILDIDSPAPNSVVGDPAGMAFISGKALALFGELQTFDIVFAIDTSESTSSPSGADVDGDGKIDGAGRPGWLRAMGTMLPFPNSATGDSVMAAEIAAVQTMLDQLDPRSTRVGIVSFDGDHDPMTPDAYTVVPLTTKYNKVRRGLDELLDQGPRGMTNMVSGVDRAMIELFGFTGAYSEKREDARHIIVFLTDGIPTLPLTGRRENARMAISRAMKAARLNIRIDTFAIGEEAIREPVVAVEMARVTNGLFTPVREPKNLRAIFEEMNFADIEKLEIRNLTTRKQAAYKIQNADGTFSALVPMREGKNVVEVHARATDGSEHRVSLPLRFVRGADAQPLSPELIAQRNRLLENQLVDLRNRSLAIEMERNEALRRELRVEIEREREAAKRRAEDAKRRLRIEAER